MTRILDRFISGLNGQAVAHRVSGGRFIMCLAEGTGAKQTFGADADRKLFLELLAQTCRRTGWQVHAYCLMDNHFHLIVETPRSNLSAGMQWLLGSYTQRFNRRHGLWGHLFGGRYKAPLLVDGRPGGNICGESATMCT